MGSAYQERHRSGSVTRRGEQDETAVGEHLVPGATRCQVVVVELFRPHPVPPQPGKVGVRAEESAQFGQRLLQCLPLLLADHNVGVVQFGQAADVVLMQM